jgi:hypothetical protein
MLAAEQLGLLAIDPRKGRRVRGVGRVLNAAMAGLLVADLHLDAARAGSSPALQVAGRLMERHGNNLEPTIKSMSRGLKADLGTDTWDTVVAGLVAQGAIAPPSGRLLPKTAVLDTSAREAIIARLREAVYSDGPVDIATAALLDAAVSGRVLDLLVSKADYRRAGDRAEALIAGTPIERISDTVRAIIVEDENQNSSD